MFNLSNRKNKNTESLSSHHGITSFKIGPIIFQDISKSKLINLITDFSETARLFTALNAHSLSLAFEDPYLHTVLNESFICFCDGFGIHVLSRFFGEGEIKFRNTPTDWLMDLVKECNKKNQKIYLLGDRKHVVEQFASQINQEHPGVICGYHHGFFRENSWEEEQIVDDINKLAPHLLLLGMGMPRQELWAARNQTQLKCSAILMTGASMAFLTGQRKRGPKWATDHGFEWLFRIIYEPFVMSLRYLIGIPKVTIQVARDRLMNRKAE